MWSKTLWLKQKPNVNVSISIGSTTSSKLRLNKLPNVNDLRLFGRSTPCSASLKRYPKVKCSRNGGRITCKLWLKCSPKVKLRRFGRSTWFWNIQRHKRHMVQSQRQADFASQDTPKLLSKLWLKLDPKVKLRRFGSFTPSKRWLKPGIFTLCGCRWMCIYRFAKLNCIYN